MSTEIKQMQINTKDIIVNPLAQRDVEQRKAQFNKIMRTFNKDLVNPVKVAYINGRYYCFDGQMTMKVLKARNGGKDLKVNCTCFYGLSDCDMADLFVEQNGTISKVNLADKLRVKKNFGDPDSVNLVRLTENNGLQISWNNSKGKNAICAIGALEKSYFDLKDNTNDIATERRFGSFIRIIKKAWNGDPDGSRAEILRGLALFIKAYDGQFDENRLAQKLSEVRPLDIIRDAQADRSSGERKYAVQILNLYNGRLRDPLVNRL